MKIFAKREAKSGEKGFIHIGIKYKSTKIGAYIILTKVNLLDSFIVIVLKIQG